MLTAATAAFLSMISYAEGTNIGEQGYAVTFDYHIIRDFDKHPNVAIIGSKYVSTAAGRYQFIKATYDEMQERCKDAIPDFTPTSQDNAAVCMLNMKGVNHVNPIETEFAFSEEVDKVSKIWASLPGAGYGQPERKLGELWRVYREELTTGKGREENGKD